MTLRRIFPVVLTILALVGAVALARAQVTETTVQLSWTAPGDDSTSGIAAQYDVRWSASPINGSNFASATRVTGMSAPQLAGSTETVTITGLTPNTPYWFALQTADESGNWSAISNIVSATTAVSSDSLAPAPLAVSVSATSDNSVTLAWNATGDDSLSGTAASYDIRWSTSPITTANWSSANQAVGEPVPATAGTPQTFTVNGLNRTVDLWFAAKSRDDVNQVSQLSNVVKVDRLLDTAPPAAPAGLAANVQSGSVHMQWNANTEPDLAGYHVYRAVSASGTYARLTSSAIALLTYTDAAPPDSAALWYEVSAMDQAGNESARSAPQQVWLSAAGISAWKSDPPYPNPSRVSDPVTIPVEVPAAGPYEGRLDIQNGAGEHVRTIALRGLSPGVTPVTWDGRNDAGRSVAPGVYRVWLIAGDRMAPVKLVRAP